MCSATFACIDIWQNSFQMHSHSGIPQSQNADGLCWQDDRVVLLRALAAEVGIAGFADVAVA